MSIAVLYENLREAFITYLNCVFLLSHEQILFNIFDKEKTLVEFMQNSTRVFVYYLYSIYTYYLRYIV